MIPTTKERPRSALDNHYLEYWNSYRCLQEVDQLFLWFSVNNCRYCWCQSLKEGECRVSYNASSVQVTVTTCTPQPRQTTVRCTARIVSSHPYCRHIGFVFTYKCVVSFQQYSRTTSNTETMNYIMVDVSYDREFRYDYGYLLVCTKESIFSIIHANRFCIKNT